MASDKHLDAEWKRIQKKTFTRWCNEHLKVQNLKIEDLTSDLSDGVRLIVLIEVLSQKKIGRYSKKPRVHAQRMENVEMALDFITKKERIRLVNIGKAMQVIVFTCTCNTKFYSCKNIVPRLLVEGHEVILALLLGTPPSNEASGKSEEVADFRSLESVEADLTNTLEHSHLSVVVL